MNTFLAILVAAQLSSSDCAAALTLRGVGTTVSRQVAPYVACL